MAIAQSQGDDAPGLLAAKLASLWAAVVTGIASVDPTQLAAWLASLYSLILLGEWIWKRLGRPFAERRGWIQRKLRRASDSTEGDDG